MIYENFYQFREKPFSPLPDASFLYLSKQHRMALNLLEYGLTNQAGFTVISGDIGTGKTTLIRRLLNDIDPHLTVGLISNTRRTFGDLMQWIAPAFDLPHEGRDKVQLYHDFVNFIVREYADGRRTVLIVDEAQNMSAETLEELRLLSNVNADKDQLLQIILLGQRELRKTLRRPDLVQFAQRIGVDYDLKPLSAAQTGEYIQHRCRLAGGNPDLFTEQARRAVYAFTGGIPRLINLLCDTALVYGYAEQRERIDEEIVARTARDKQQGGLFPAQAATAPDSESALPDSGIDATDFAASGGQDAQPFAACAPAALPTAAPRGSCRHEGRDEVRFAKTGTLSDYSGKLRIAIAADSKLVGTFLAKLMSRFDIQVVEVLPLQAPQLRRLHENTLDILLVVTDSHLNHLDDAVYELLLRWNKPVLFNDSLATEADLSQPGRLEFGRRLSRKLYSYAPRRHSPQPESPG